MFSLLYISVIIVELSTLGLSTAQEFSDLCLVPPYPNHGSHKAYVDTDTDPKIGYYYTGLVLNVTCDPGYSLVGEGRITCLSARWSSDIPTCVRYCVNGSEPNVISCGSETRCVLQEHGKLPEVGLRIIPDIEDNSMCGIISNDYVPNIVGGRTAVTFEMPWHAAVYKKTTTPYMQICGATVISRSVVISAAHCFWSDLDKQQPARNYAIAAGKVYRPWNDPNDEKAQKTDVKDIKIPPRFHGSSTNYQDDLALVFVVSMFTFNDYVKPICMNFDQGLDEKQLRVGQFGKVAGWGLTEEDGRASPVLKVVELPFVPIEECLAETPEAFKAFITSDKICAGLKNGTAVCKGDSGGCLAFLEVDKSVFRYYLRGVVSTAPRSDHLCNAYDRTTFTHIVHHERFIKKHMI